MSQLFHIPVALSLQTTSFSFSLPCGAFPLPFLPLETQVDSLDVGILVGYSVKSSGTMGALVRLLICVDVLMLPQMGLDGKSLVAILAVVGLLVFWGVRSQDVSRQASNSSGIGKEKSLSISLSVR